MNRLTDSNQAVGAAASRRSFLKRSTAVALAGGSAAVLLNSMGRPALAASSSDNANYTSTRTLLLQIRDHEAAHVKFLVSALGSAARPKPTFKGLEQSSMANFTKLAQALENTGCGAYLGAVPAINSKAYLAAAGTIALVEARHAGWLNSFQGDPLTGNALNPKDNGSFEDPLTAGQVADLAGPFVASLNGGPALTYSTTPSNPNDIAILNFALALEYLEAEFYAVNSHKFL